MSYQHKAFAEAEAAWNSGTDPASLLAAACLPAFYGEEGPSREIVIAEQRSFIAGWLTSTHQSAIIMREIAERRAEAFAAEGLT